MIKTKLSWQDIENTAENLAKQLSDKIFYGIIAVTKGGMIPAALIAAKLGINIIETISIKSYNEENKQTKLQVLKQIDLYTRDKNWLVIDDLVDTGATFTLMRKYMKNSTFAVLYAKPQGKPLCDMFAEEVEQDNWLIFPWEK